MKLKERRTGNDLSYVQINYLATESALDIDKIKTLNIIGTVNSKQKLIIVLLTTTTPITPLRPLAVDEIAEIITSTTLHARSKCLKESQASNLAIASGLPINVIKALPIRGSVITTLIVVVKNTKIQITPERQLAEGEVAEIVSSRILNEKISHLTERQVKYLTKNSGLPAESIQALNIVGNLKLKLTVVLENTATPITRERPLADGEIAEIVCKFTLQKRTHTLTEYQANYLAENSGLSVERIKALKIVGDLDSSLMVVLKNTVTPVTRAQPLADGQIAEIICTLTLKSRTHTLMEYQVDYLTKNSGLSAECIKALRVVGSLNTRLTVVLENTAIPITPERPLADGEIAEIVSKITLQRRTHTLTEYQANYLSKNSGLPVESIKALKIVGDLRLKLTIVSENTATPITQEQPLADGEIAEIVSANILKKRIRQSTTEGEIINTGIVEKLLNNSIMDPTLDYQCIYEELMEEMNSRKEPESYTSPAEKFPSVVRHFIEIDSNSCETEKMIDIDRASYRDPNSTAFITAAFSERVFSQDTSIEPANEPPSSEHLDTEYLEARYKRPEDKKRKYSDCDFTDHSDRSVTKRFCDYNSTFYSQVKSSRPFSEESQHEDHDERTREFNLPFK